MEYFFFKKKLIESSDRAYPSPLLRVTNAHNRKFAKGKKLFWWFSFPLNEDGFCKSSNRRCSIRKGVLRNFGLRLHFIERGILAQVFSCAFREISRNNFFLTEHLRRTLLGLRFPLKEDGFKRFNIKVKL